jgi:hypothetical protein
VCPFFCQTGPGPGQLIVDRADKKAGQRVRGNKADSEMESSSRDRSRREMTMDKAVLKRQATEKDSGRCRQKRRERGGSGSVRPKSMETEEAAGGNTEATDGKTQKDRTINKTAERKDLWLVCCLEGRRGR